VSKYTVRFLTNQADLDDHSLQRVTISRAEPLYQVRLSLEVDESEIEYARPLSELLYQLVIEEYMPDCVDKDIVLIDWQKESLM
jgi:hypothetical protein